jgi:predicted  nucleic acid-binding Zn-ribbon protein
VNGDQQNGVGIPPEKLIAALQQKLGSAMGTITAHEVAMEQFQSEAAEKQQRIEMLLARCEVAERQVQAQQEELGELREQLDSGDSSG